MPPLRAISPSRMAYEPLVAVLAAVCAGMALDRWLSIPLLVSWLMAGAAWAAWCWAWRVGRLQLSAILLLTCLATLGGAWNHCRWSLFDQNDLGLFAREALQPAAIEARATSGPRRIPAPPYDPLRTIATQERTRVEIEVLAIRDGEQWRPASGVASLFVQGHLEGVRPGDVLQLFAQLGATREPANPGEFNFANQARADRRLCTVNCEFPECVTRTARGWPFAVRDLVDALRTTGDGLLWRNIGPSRSGLAAAMFLGSRERLDPDLTQAFVETGTIHLLVVSGMNVGFLAGMLIVVLRLAQVRTSWTMGIVAVACLLYAMTTDAEPPVVRATVMVLVGCLAMVLARKPLGFNSLAAAGLVVLALNPAELFESGTQLSFLSVGVLAYMAPTRARPKQLDPLDRLIARTRPWPQRMLRKAGWRIWQLTLVSFVIWLVICPLVMTRFHLVSPVAVLLGPLLAIPVALAMWSSFGVFALGWLVPPAAALLGSICDANLALLENVVDWSRTWPANHAWVAGPSNWWLAGFYGGLACWVFFPRRRPAPRWGMAIAALWISTGLLAAVVAKRGPEKLECTFLSVGHGAAVVVELPGGQTLLYDAGRLGSPVAAARAVSGFLWSRGITRLDAIVISHADADHYNAVPALLDQFSVGAVYVSPTMFEDRSGALAALRESIVTMGIPLKEVWGGDHLQTNGPATIEVRHPPRRGVLGSDNANSIVLAIEYEGRRILLTGDLESPGLQDVIAETPYDCDVVLTPHHGSMASDPPGFAAWSTPEWAIVSGGFNDRLPAVEAAYRAEGGEVLHTATSGAVQVSVIAGVLSVDTWRNSP